MGHEEKDCREFVELFLKSQRSLYAFIRAQVRSRDDADEVLQQTSVILWEKFHTFRRDGSFTRWACGIARLEVLTHLRNRRRLRVMLSEDIADAISRKLENAVNDIDVRIDMLVRCMQDLDKRDRELIQRHYARNQTVKEIASASGVSESSVYKSLNRSRDKLFECVRRRLAERKVS